MRCRCTPQSTPLITCSTHQAARDTGTKRSSQALQRNSTFTLQVEVHSSQLNMAHSNGTSCILVRVVEIPLLWRKSHTQSSHSLFNKSAIPQQFLKHFIRIVGLGGHLGRLFIRMSTTQCAGLGASVTVRVTPTPASARNSVRRRSRRLVEHWEGRSWLQGTGGEPQVLLNFRNEVLHVPSEEVLLGCGGTGTRRSRWWGSGQNARLFDAWHRVNGFRGARHFSCTC